MYMRLVHRKVKPESLSAYSHLYETRNIPELQRAKGCLYAALIQSAHHHDECVSLTLWDEKENADAYESSGAFHTLFDEAAPYLADSDEWNIHLAEDLTLHYDHVPVQPVINEYQVNGDPSAVPQESSLYIRLVSPRFRPGMLEEFKKIYNAEILPALRKVKGCRYMYLTENVKIAQLISITIWESKADADQYERSGLFDQLSMKAAHTFSEIYQWKREFEKESGGKAVASEEMTVEGYRIIASKSFK
jgi:quinol monooxygenase YgiN